MKTLLERIADMAACVGGNVGEVLLDAAKEINALRARIELLERQEPVGWLLDGDFYEVRQMSLYRDNEPLPGQTALYALPGAKGE